MMREYRAQLDAERARKLANGRNHSSSKSDRKKGWCRGHGNINTNLYLVFTSLFSEGESMSLQIGRIKI